MLIFTVIQIFHARMFIVNPYPIYHCQQLFFFKSSYDILLLCLVEVVGSTSIPSPSILPRVDFPLISIISHALSFSNKFNNYCTMLFANIFGLRYSPLSHSDVLYYMVEDLPQLWRYSPLSHSDVLYYFSNIHYNF